jgi:peptidyl-prolyl cis-trans isomerase A (cyclophilin A)
MRLRIGLAAALCFCMVAAASAQVVRFETTMGNFDMVLNPTDNPLLEGHVENMLNYVNNGSYMGNWINRASTGFVLQMGGFYSMTTRPSPTEESVRSVRAFTPVTGEPGIPGLSNTNGTVSVALSGNSDGTVNHDSGGSSFFVNVADNSQSLDPDFTVFAAIPDMSVINSIMALQTIDRTQDPNFGADSGNLAFTTVPIQADGKQVFITRAFVVTDGMTIAADDAAVGATMAASAQTFGNSANSLSAPDLTSPALSAAGLSQAAASAGGLSSHVVPEPASALLMAIASLGASGFVRRRRR